MSAIYVLNIILCIWLTTYYPFYLSKKLQIPFLNPITITFIFAFPVTIAKLVVGPIFFLEGGLLNPFYNYSVFITSVELFCTYVVTKLAISSAKKRSVAIENFIKRCKSHWVVRRKKMLKVSVFLLLLSVFFFILLASHSYGVLNWMKDSRTGYQYHRVGVGQYYAFFLLFLSTSFSLILMYVNGYRKVILSYLLFIPIIWLLGSKGQLLNFTIYALIILWFKKYRYINRFFIIFLPAIFGLMLLNLGSTSVVEIAEYFNDGYVNSAKYFEEYFAGNIELFYGEIWTTQFWELIPRGLYENKPYVYGITLLNEYFFPGMAEQSHTPAFEGPVSIYADFGFVGLTMSALLNLGLFFKIIAYYFVLKKKNFSEICDNPILLYTFLLLFAPSFLTFFLFPWSLIVFVFLIKNISVGNRLVCRIYRK